MTRPVPYAREVWAETARGRHPAVAVFVGAEAEEAALRHRVQHGLGTALPIRQGVDPSSLDWPPLTSPTVVSCGASAYQVSATMAALRASGAKQLSVLVDD